MANDNTSPLCCPSCGSDRIAVFRQPTSKFSSSGAVPALRCADCGHRAVGSAFPGTPEQARQTRSAPLPPRLPTPVRKPAPSLNRAEPEVERTAPVVPATAAPAPRPAPAAAAPSFPAPSAPAPKPAPTKVARIEGPACSWKECEKAARPGSKYCSRECSNKNARWRYSQRGADDSAAA